MSFSRKFQVSKRPFSISGGTGEGQLQSLSHTSPGSPSQGRIPSTKPLAAPLRTLSSESSRQPGSQALLPSLQSYQAWAQMSARGCYS